MLYSIDLIINMYFDDFRKKSIVQYRGVRKYEGVLYENWMTEVVDWWNEYLIYMQGGSKGYKKSQLHI